MFEPLLQSAMASGSQVIVCLKNQCTDYQGHILQIEDGCFSLFHSGPNGGIRWVFRLQDVLTCGLIMELPEGLRAIDSTEELLACSPLQSIEGEPETDRTP